MSVFNFFIVLSSIILTGLATCVVGERVFAPIGIPLGLLLTALALTFWKLDQRTSFLVKRAEEVLETVEANHFPEFARIIGSEPTEFQELNSKFGWFRRRWTYEPILGLVYLVVAAMGLTGTALSGSRMTGAVTWFDKNPELAKPQIDVVAINSIPEKPAPKAAAAPENKKRTKAGWWICTSTESKRGSCAFGDNRVVYLSGPITTGRRFVERVRSGLTSKRRRKLN